MASLVPYFVSVILLILVLEIISGHKKIKNLSDIFILSFFISILTLFFDVFAGKAPDYALVIFALLIATGVMYFYWKQDDFVMPLVIGFIYAGIWLSMQIWVSLIVVSIVIITSFLLHLKRKS